MLNDFLGGAITFGFLIISLFFLKFWAGTRDRLFAAFALAFFLFGIERIVEYFLRSTHGQTPAVYLIRLSAFILIVCAIVQKNMEAKR